MTVIRPNSVSGITSITAQANEINFFRSNGALAGLQLNGVNFNTTTGVSTFNNLDVGGVLTYQDVTNVDSLGIGTFRTGINVSGGQLDVGSNIKLGNAGVITATSFSGSGANLTGINADLVNDSSPQLGGDLASNGNDILIADNDQIKLGTGNDLTMRHNGSASVIENFTGNFILGAATSGNIEFQQVINGEVLAKFISNGAVELYHDNTKRLETTSSGVEIPQALFVGEKIDMPDHTSGTNGMILLGTGDDLFMYHDGTNSHLRNNTGTFNVRAGNFRLTDTAIQHVYLNANSNGNDEIALYYDNSVKLTTASNGIDITGMCTDDGARHDGDVYFIGGTSGRNAVWDMSDNALEFADNARAKFGSSDDLQIFHVSDGISKIEDSGGGFHIRQINGGDIHIHAGANNASSNNRLVARSAGAAELYHTGSKKLETTSTGVEVTGKLQLDDGNGTLQTGNYLSVGTGEDLRMFHAGGDSYLRNFGGFFSLGCSNNADLKIVTNGSNRWIFQNDGQFRPDSNNSLDIGTTNYRVRNIYTNDLNLSNKGSTNSVDNTWGDYTIQEGESDLFLINNRNGKKYKFNLTEVS